MKANGSKLKRLLQYSNNGQIYLKLLKPINKLIDYFGPTRRLYYLSKAKRLTKYFEASYKSSPDAEHAQFPPDERVECPSIWMAELFTPSTLKGLNKGLKIFDEEKFSTPSSKLEKWLKDTREGKSAGWINLHTISLDKSYNPLKVGGLPRPHPHIYQVTMSLTSISTSLTLLNLRFDFDTEYYSVLENSMREREKSKYEKTHKRSPLKLIRYILFGGNQLHNRSMPSHSVMKERAYCLEIGGIEKKCAIWIKNFFPGFFSLSGVNHYPRVGLYITDKRAPFTSDMDKQNAFLGPGFDNQYSVYTMNHYSNVRFTQTTDKYNDTRRLNFACRRNDVELMSGFSDTEEDASSLLICGHLEHGIVKLMTSWTFSRFLDTCREVLAKKRDLAAANQSFSTLKNLKELRELTQYSLYDIELACRDITKLSSDNFFLQEHASAEHFSCGEKKGTLAGYYKIMFKEKGEQIIEETKTFLEMMKTVTGLTQNISTARLQRVILLISISSLCVALIAFFAK
mgnify:CR=1 FL=1